jgi:hypothetical protein
MLAGLVLLRNMLNIKMVGVKHLGQSITCVALPSYAPVRHGLHGDLPRQKPPTRGLNPRSHRAWRGEADLRHPSLDWDSQERCGLRPTHCLGETGQEEHLNLEEH